MKLVETLKTQSGLRFVVVHSIPKARKMPRIPRTAPKGRLVTVQEKKWKGIS